MWTKVVILVLILNKDISVIANEFYISAVETEKLVHAENYVIETLEQSLNLLILYKETVKSAILDRSAHKIEDESYVKSPTRVFSLMKRLTIDVDNLRSIHNNTKENIQKIFDGSSFNLPTMEDLEGISELIGRVQYNYELNMRDFVNGVIRGVKYGNPMNSEDLFHLGISVRRKNYVQSVKFLQMALKACYTDNLLSPKTIVETMADVCIENGRPKKALIFYNWYLAEEDSDDVDIILKKVATLKSLKEIQNVTDVKSTDNAETSKPQQKNLVDIYAELCNEELELPSNVTSRFKCYYKFGKTLFLRIAPIKIEEIYLDPDVYLIHDIVSADEAENIRNMAKTKVRRSSVIRDGKSFSSKSRISSALLLEMNGTHQVAERIFKRCLDAADLLFVNEMRLQINNYGVGGHYFSHYDFFDKITAASSGNREATILVYLTDVEEGGLTVFPKLGIGAKPQMGKALFWKNLHSSGECDFSTLHAACPVIVGSKWVANIWVTTYKQTLTCGQEYRSETFERVLPKPVEKSSMPS